MRSYRKGFRSPDFTRIAYTPSSNDWQEVTLKLLRGTQLTSIYNTLASQVNWYGYDSTGTFTGVIKGGLTLANQAVIITPYSQHPLN